MAISLVNTLNLTGTTGASAGVTSLSLSGLTIQADDVLVLLWNDARTASRGTTATGDNSGAYSEQVDTFADDTNDTNFGLYLQKQGGTPDTSISVDARVAGVRYVAKVMQWRGVDTTTQIDVATPAATTGIDGNLANPPSITPSTAGARIIYAYAASRQLDTTWTAPANASNWTEIKEGTDAPSVRLGVGHHEWTSGAFDPDAVTGVAGNRDSWVGATIALRPAVTGVTLTPDLFTNSQTFHAPTASATYALTPALFTNSASFHAPTVSPGAVTLSPSLLTNGQTFYAPTVAGLQTLSPALFDNSVGQEIVSNGTFDTDATGWTASASASLSAVGGRLRVSRTATSPVCTASQSDSTTVGRIYAYSAEMAVGTAGFCSVRLGSAANGFNYGLSSTFLSGTFVATTTAAHFTCYNAGSVGTYAEFDNISLKATPFFSTTVAAGAVTLSPSLFTNTQTFYGPTITVGAAELQPSLLTNGQTFYEPTVIGGGTISPALFTNTNTFHAATVSASYTLTPALLTNTAQFFAATIESDNAIVVPLLTNGQAFYSPAVAAAPVPLLPALFRNKSALYTPRVAYRGPYRFYEDPFKYRSTRVARR